MKLKGIGSVLAERIIQYRKMHGYFRSVDELIKIKGIGPKTLEKLRPYITIKYGIKVQYLFVRLYFRHIERRVEARIPWPP